MRLPHSGLGMLTPAEFASFSQRFEVAFSILRTKISPLEAGSDLGSRPIGISFTTGPALFSGSSRSRFVVNALLR